MSVFEPTGKSPRRLSPKAFIAALLAAVVIVLLGWLVHLRVALDARSQLTAGQMRAVSEQKEALQTEVDEVAGTASELARIAAAHLTQSPDGSTGANETLASVFLNYARTREMISQLRLIAPDGRELVNIKRIKTRTGSIYFRDTTPEKSRYVTGEKWAAGILALTPGQMAVSGLTLKAGEDGQLEIPHLAILRAGAAVQMGRGQNPGGFVVVETVADNLFRRLARVDGYLKTTTLISDARGYWLRGSDPAMEWGFLLPENSRQTLAISHPDVWNVLSQSSSGSVQNAGNVVTFDTMNLRSGESPPLVPASQPAWKIITWLTPQAIAEHERASTKQVWVWVALALGLCMPVTYLMVSDRDQKREVARSREQTRALLQSIADTSADGIIAGEAVRHAGGDIKDFRLVFSNPVAGLVLQSFGRDKGETEGTHEFPLFFAPDFFSQCVRVVITGSRYETEQFAEGDSLGPRWFRILVVKLEDGVVLTFTDVTHQKVAVNELSQAKEAAESANRAKTQFLTMMGHEIRTPMNGLLGFASLLEKTELTPEQADYVSILRLSGEAFLRILDDILDYSHMEYDALHVKSAPVDVRELVTQVGQLFTMALGNRNLELVTKVAHEVPAQIVSDDVRLRQILVNLVGNALKFTQEGFLLVKVVRETDEHGDFIVFHVVDSGLGISPEIIDRLFKPFSQVDSGLSRQFGGTGLGLSICKRLVETMGGTIGVNSTPGKGSDFFFSLPVRIPEFPARRSVPIRERSFLQPVSRILVVDDDPINRKLIQRMVEKMGGEVVLTESGAQAIQAFQNSCFDLILMDIQMPGMDGMETTRKIRDIERRSGERHRTRIAALTANSGEDARDQCLESGMDDFLHKPVRINELESLIERNVV